MERRGILRMGLDFVRNNSARCPLVLVLGLMFASFLLLCNWWLLSSQNSELLKQVDTLADQLRIIGKQLGTCSQQEMLLNEKLKDSQSGFIKQQVAIEQIRESEDDIKEAYEKLKEELNTVKRDCSAKNVQKKLDSCISQKTTLLKLSESCKDLAIKGLETEKSTFLKEIPEKNSVMKYLKEKLNSTKTMTGKLYKTDVFVMNDSQGNAPVIYGRHNHLLDQGSKGQDKDEYEELKNYGDSSMIPLENDDPREQAMKSV